MMDSNDSIDYNFSSDILNLNLNNLKSLLLLPLPEPKQPKFGVGGVCIVCGDTASGRHYGAISCEGCKGFFKRSIRKNLGYSCRAIMQCEITKSVRNRCQYCRLQKCLQVGMHSDSVQSERRPPANRIQGESSGNTMNLLSLPLFHNESFEKQNSSLVSTSSSADEDTPGSGNVGESVTLRERNKIGRAIETIQCVITEGRENCSGRFKGIKYDNEVIIPEEWSQFVLVGPGTELISNNGVANLPYICEIASRLLFLSVDWAQSLPVFQTLPFEVQLTIMKSSWTDLFAVGLVQCQNLIPFMSVVSALITHLQISGATASKLTVVAEHISKLQVLIKYVQNLSLDDFELSALKGLALFSADRYAQFGTSMCKSVQDIQGSILKQIREHRSEKDDGRNHVDKMLLFLPQLRSFDTSVFEEVFFSSVLGAATKIENVIPYIMKLDPILLTSSSSCDTVDSNNEQNLVMTSK